ncbi:hypothetical protein KY290_031091 [Solanum tuberosum]|uniref:Uncharacterized protein n=1 Tax=Solanum tuberosum TaxID=4113 RepID=A0ABQ7U8G5_SOLTU|nr:hypothetical protein KY290_031091 [Solanum tuberosum]
MKSTPLKTSSAPRLSSTTTPPGFQDQHTPLWSSPKVTLKLYKSLTLPMYI